MNDLLEERAKGSKSDFNSIVTNQQKSNNLENDIISFIQYEKNGIALFENTDMHYKDATVLTNVNKLMNQ